MRAAVTGSSGHLGTNLVRRLLSEGWRVTTVDPRFPEIEQGTFVEHHRADICDQESLRTAFEGADVVFHLAARISLLEDDPEVHRVNVEGAEAAARAALAVGVERYVHCSSVHAFDIYRNDTIDETSVRSVDPSLPIYDRSKAEGEEVVRKVIADGLDAVIVNPTAIVGPVDPIPSRVGGMLRSAARGRMPAIIDGGFNWVDVRDVVAGILAARERGRTGESYLLPGHVATSLELTRLAARANGRKGPMGTIPLGITRPVMPIADKLARRFGSDVMAPASFGALDANPEVSGAKAGSELGYEPRPLAETVGDLIDWFRSQGSIR